jgi:hypothetical protein
MQVDPLYAMILEEQAIQREMDLIDDEWTMAGDQTCETNRLALELFKNLTTAMRIADELNRLKQPLEASFSRQVTGKLNAVWALARSLVLITGGFKTAQK